MPDRAVFRARVCAAELAANALEHGGARGERDCFVVALWSRADGTLGMRFTDTGAPFDPTLAASPRRSSDESSLGGRGLKLIDSLSKARRYAREGDRNVLELYFEDAPA